MLRKTPVALGTTALLSLYSLLSSSSALAQTAPEAQTEAAHRLGEVTVSATRTERQTNAVPNTVSVYNQRTLGELNARDLKDLLDDEVDLAVRAQANRFSAAGSSTGRGGVEGINIRGLEGNQVLMMVDGIRLPLGFSFGPFAGGRGDYFDLDTLRSAEVLRGPASAQFGSDGLAGALSLTTLSPDDLLKSGKTFGGFMSSGYDSVDNSWKVTGAVAAAAGDWQGLLLATRRQGHETENRADNNAPNSTRTLPNPLDYTADTVLAKVGYRLNANHRLMASLEARQRESNTNALSGVAPIASAATSVIGLTGDDQLERQRFSLEHRYEDLNAPWLQSLRTQFYVQQAKNRQSAAEDRNTSADRTRETRYSEDLIGLSTQAQTQLSGQRLSYGLDISRNRIEALRNGTPAGTDFPNKPFPDTDYTQVGAFVQDELELGDISLIPGLRFEHYSLKPKSAGYTGSTVKLSDQAVTPRLGLIWRASPQLQPYAQWAQGFRAPAPDQVNNGFSNLTVGYTSIGNPDLKPEHANSFELGLRGQLSGGISWQLSAYDNRYRDFIDQVVVGGSFTTADPAIYQYINLSKARIKGVEARARWQATTGLSFDASLAHASGEKTQDGLTTPLDTVQPTRARLAARYRLAAWDLQAAWQHSEAKKASDISTAASFATPRYDIVDISAAYRFSPSLSVSAGINNLTDKKYWRWSDVRGIAANSTVLDAYTAPGRQFQLALRADF